MVALRHSTNAWWLAFASVLLGGLVGAVPKVNALTLNSITNRGTQDLSGTFKNGAEFIYRPATWGDTATRSTLSFEKKGYKTDHSMPIFRTLNIMGTSTLTPPYTLPAATDDRIAFFTQLHTIHFLTDEGVIGKVWLKQPVTELSKISILASRGDFAVLKLEFIGQLVQLIMIDRDRGDVLQPKDGKVPAGVTLGELEVEKLPVFSPTNPDLKVHQISLISVVNRTAIPLEAALPPKSGPPAIELTDHEQVPNRPIEIGRLTENWIVSMDPEPISTHLPTPSPVAGSISRFTNGSWIEAIPDGKQSSLRYHPSAKAQPILLAVADEVSIRDHDINHPSEMAIVETSDEFLLVLQSGIQISLPVERQKLFLVNGEAQLNRMKFGFGEHTFWVISFKHTQSAQGETYVVRDDGIFVRVDLESHQFSGNAPVEGAPPKVLVQDGFLILDKGPRVLDLTHFEAETRTQASRLDRVKTGEGAEISNIIQYVDAEIPDLVEKLRRQEIKTFPISPRHLDTIVADIEEGLNSEEVASVAITAPSGAGKSQFAYAFFKALQEGRFKQLPRSTKIYKIDALQLSQGTKFVGVFEAKLKAIVEAAKIRPTILFIDEMQNLIQVGAHKDNPIGFFSYLLEAMASGQLRVVGTCTDYDFFHYFLSNPVLARRFSEARLPEPSREEALEILRQWVISRKGPRRVPTLEVLERIYELSSRLNPEGAQPAKATKLLDRAFSRVETGRGDGKLIPTLVDVDESALRLYKADRALIDPSIMKQRATALRQALNQSHAGQDDVKALLQELTEQSYLAQSQPFRIGLVGIKGTGKTSLFKSWAAAMGFPEAKVIGMGAHAQGDAKAFFRQLAQALEVNAFTPILLDELDAAHPDIQIALQTALQEGYFFIESTTNLSSGASTFRRISLANSPIAFTTNLGSAFIDEQLSSKGKGSMVFGNSPLRAAGPTPRELAAKLKAAVSNERSTADTFIRPELLERFPWLAPFLPSTREQFAQAVRIHLSIALSDHSRKQKAPVTLSNPEEFVAFASQHYFQPGDSMRVAQEVVQVFVGHEVKEARMKATGGERLPIEIQFNAASFQTNASRMSGCELLLKRSQETLATPTSK